MAAINMAYDCLDRAQREGSSVGPQPLPVGPGRPTPTRASSPPSPPRPPAGSLLGRVMAARHVDTPVLDCGKYSGWRISEVADHDPRYLVWLSRHSSGIRYRSAIQLVLGSRPDIGRRAAVLG